jgi:hypothetical protein
MPTSSESELNSDFKHYHPVRGGREIREIRETRETRETREMGRWGAGEKSFSPLPNAQCPMPYFFFDNLVRPAGIEPA